MEKGCFWWNRLLSVLILAIFVLLVGCKLAEEPPQGFLIEGVAIEKGVVTALEGYKFEIVKGNDEDGESVALRSIRTGQLQGTWDCGCAPGSTAGCKAVIIDNSLSCEKTVCEDCWLAIEIDTLKLSGVIKARLSLPCKIPSKTV